MADWLLQSSNGVGRRFIDGFGGFCVTRSLPSLDAKICVGYASSAMHSNNGLWVEPAFLIFTFFVIVPSIAALQFGAEFFSASTHPQFANPDSNFSSPTFGVISGTSVSARVTQLAVKLSFSSQFSTHR
jgi:hypothetical protein